MCTSLPEGCELRKGSQLFCVCSFPIWHRVTCEEVRVPCRVGPRFGGFPTFWPRVRARGTDDCQSTSANICPPDCGVRVPSSLILAAPVKKSSLLRHAPRRCMLAVRGRCERAVESRSLCSRCVLCTYVVRSYKWLRTKWLLHVAMVTTLLCK